MRRRSGKIPAARQELLSLDELEKIIAEPGDFPQKAALASLSDGCGSTMFQR